MFAGRLRSTSRRTTDGGKEYGGLRVDQAKRLRELEKENGRLKKVVADQALDISILKEASSGNF